MTPLLSVTLSNHLSELERLHQVLLQFGNDRQLPKNVINTINLALEELVTNVIEHGYQDGREHSILIRFSIQEGKVLAEVEDDARQFNPLEAPVPDFDKPLEDRPIGGLGIHLVRNVMDGLDYSYREGKNCMTLQKQIDG